MDKVNLALTDLLAIIDASPDSASFLVERKSPCRTNISFVADKQNVYFSLLRFFAAHLFF